MKVSDVKWGKRIHGIFEREGLLDKPLEYLMENFHKLRRLKGVGSLVEMKILETTNLALLDKQHYVYKFHEIKKEFNKIDESIAKFRNEIEIANKNLVLLNDSISKALGALGNVTPGFVSDVRDHIVASVRSARTMLLDDIRIQKIERELNRPQVEPMRS